MRTSEDIEKKSVMLVREVRALAMKVCHPREYHQKNISVIAIRIL